MSEDVKPEVIEKTQKLLGKHISKPVLSEKLLRKPPFRFLHDIVTAVIKDTGFLKGMYTESELISDNVKERELKIAFLTKLIDAIKILTEIDLKVKPTKIIAGLEPAETNKLLQAIGYALDKKIDSTEYIKKISVKSKISDKAKKVSKTIAKENEQKDSQRNKKRESEITKPEKTKKKGNESTRDNISVEKLSKIKKEKSKKDNKSDMLSSSTTNDSKTKNSNTNHMNEDIVKKEIDSKDIENSSNVEASKEEQYSKKELNSQEKLSKISTNIDENIVVVNKNTEQQQNTEHEHYLKHNTQNDAILEENVNLKTSVREEVQKQRMDRPKSARPQSGDLKKNATAKMSNIEETTINQKLITSVLARPMSSLRPPSVRPSSARPGAPRLRPDSSLPLSEIVPLGKINVIIEDFNAKDDEEETVVIHNAELEIEPIQKVLDIPEDKGHLVEQILEQIHDEDVVDHVKSKNEIDWESKVGFHNKDAINREISQARSQIQSLTKVANPLGKLMNYLHEDVESMLSELNAWINMKREVYKEIAKQKKNNEDSSKPVILHLQELDDSIRKQEAEIVNIRSNILKNDLRIKELVTK